MEKLVSVIVPIYKVEPYLRRAIDSIIGQTYSNLEIILVDDGSPDGCGQICDAYADKDKRITVIHKENGGLSDARNAGLDAASGDFIAFVDSDDYIAENFVEELLLQIEQNDADVAMCSYAVTELLETDKAVFASSADADESYRDETIEVCSRKELLSNLYDANHRDATYFIVSWNKLYKAHLWEGIRFPKGKIHEDEATTYRIYDNAAKGIYIHRPLYAYFSAPASITRSSFSVKRLDWMDALDERIAYFEDKGEPEQAAYAKRARADAAIHYYYPLKETLPEEKVWQKKLKSYIREMRKEDIPVSKRLAYELFLLSVPLYRIVTCIDRDEKERSYQFAFVLLFCLLAFLCFYKLDVKYVDPWDESRHGVNAYEMLKEGNLIRSTYLYETDYYNLKPPLSMWSIMISMLLFGKTVFAMRLPSALYYLILALCTAVFVRKRYGRAPALLCLMFLSANTTPFLAHMVRAGDADSLYVLIFTLAMLCMLRIRDNYKNLYWCGFLFALAFLTKSFHAGVIAVIGGLYLLLTGEWKRMKPGVWLRFITSAVLPIGVWGVCRYLTDGTSFLKEMWYTDVLGRSGKGFGSNEAGFGYYFSYYLGKMSGQIQIYLLVLCAMILAGIFWLVYEKKQENSSFWKACKQTVFHRDTIGFALWIIVPAVAFSCVSTKLLWYQYPTITALLIAGAVALGRIVETSSVPSVCRRIIWVGSFAVAGIYYLILAGTFRGYGINGAQTNAFQLLIQETAETNERLDGVQAYVLLETGEQDSPYQDQWAQQDVFLAEAYGDYLCREGGLDAILQKVEEDCEEESLLFTTIGCYQSMVRPALDTAGILPQIVGSNEQYVAVHLE
jgi:glycosyltransferase involved in cell wall biosynthesis